MQSTWPCLNIYLALVKGQFPTQTPASTAVILLSPGEWELSLLLPLYLPRKDSHPNSCQMECLTKGSLQGTLCCPESASESILCLQPGTLEIVFIVTPVIHEEYLCFVLGHLSWKDAKWISPEDRGGGIWFVGVFFKIWYLYATIIANTLKS